MILETERLHLRPIVTDDWRALFPLMNDPVVMAHWDSTEVDDPDVVRQMLVAQHEDMARDLAYYWAIERAASPILLRSSPYRSTATTRPPRRATDCLNSPSATLP